MCSVLPAPHRPLSSAAYPPDEILLTLSLTGLSAYSFPWETFLLVAALMLVVLPPPGRTSTPYPSGGGDYEVAAVKPNGGLTGVFEEIPFARHVRPPLTTASVR